MRRALLTAAVVFGMLLLPGSLSAAATASCSGMCYYGSNGTCPYCGFSLFFGSKCLPLTETCGCVEFECGWASAQGEADRLACSEELGMDAAPPASFMILKVERMNPRT